MDLILIERSRPVHGQPVSIAISWNGKFAVMGELPFMAWIKLNKLLQKGMELDTREGNPLGVKVVIKGLASPGIGNHEERLQQHFNSPSPVLPVPEDDEDATDLEAVKQAEAQTVVTDELVKSLRGNPDEDN